MGFSQYFDENGVKILVVIVSMIVGSSALLEGLAKLAEVKKNVVREELWKDAATVNKIGGAFATIVVACLTFGPEVFGILIAGAVLLTFAPFLVFKIRKKSRAASDAELQTEALKEEQRKALIDSLIAAEIARTATAVAPGGTQSTSV